MQIEQELKKSKNKFIQQREQENREQTPPKVLSSEPRSLLPSMISPPSALGVFHAAINRKKLLGKIDDENAKLYNALK